MLGRELLLACEAGNAHRARGALAAGAPIGVTGKMGDTPLHCALRHGHEEVVQVLLEAMLPEWAQGGAYLPVDKKNNHGDTPLHMAAERCYVKVVRQLLESGASANATNHVRARRPAAMTVHAAERRTRASQEGRTPLHNTFAEEGGARVVRRLLEAGARVDAVDKARAPSPDTTCQAARLRGMLLRAQLGQMPLHWVASGGRVEAARQLLAMGANADPAETSYVRALLAMTRHGARS